ncbi:hypothetical protein BASA82_000309 [Batrachochytrium salamandrivorans]|nr:hypothetical protein BASA82_000309 [Batrachochytrium salamandrivorans]
MDKLLDQIRAKVEHTLSLLRSQSLARKRLFAVTFAIFFYSIARQYSRYRQRVGGLAPNHQSVDLTLEESATALYNTKLAGLEQQLGLPTLVNGQVKPQVLVAGQAGSGKTSFVSQQPSDKIQFVEVSEGEEEDGGDTSPHLVLLFVDAANVQVSDKMKQLVKKHEDKAFVLLNRADELSGRKQAILQAFGRAVVQLGGEPHQGAADLVCESGEQWRQRVAVRVPSQRAPSPPAHFPAGRGDRAATARSLVETDVLHPAPRGTREGLVPVPTQSWGQGLDCAQARQNALHFGTTAARLDHTSPRRRGTRHRFAGQAAPFPPPRCQTPFRSQISIALSPFSKHYEVEWTVPALVSFVVATRNEETGAAKAQLGFLPELGGHALPRSHRGCSQAAHMRLNHNKIIRNIAHMLVGSGEQQAELAEFIAVLCSALRLMLRDCDAGVTCAIRATCLLTRVKDNQELVALSPKLKFLAAFIVANKLQEDFDQAVSNRFWAKTLKGELPQNKLLGLELAFLRGDQVRPCHLAPESRHVAVDFEPRVNLLVGEVLPTFARTRVHLLSRCRLKFKCPSTNTNRSTTRQWRPRSSARRTFCPRWTR